MRKLLVSACILLISNFSSADSTHEVFVSSATVSGATNNTFYSVSPGYSMRILPWIQASASVTLNSSSYMFTSVSSFQLMLGPTFNIAANPLENSFFVFSGLVIKSVSGEANGTTVTPENSSPGATGSSSSTSGPNKDDPSGVGFGLIVGKRFLIAPGLTFRPSIGVIGAGTLGYVINVMSASYCF